MIWRVEIKDKEGVFDAVGEAVVKDIQDLRIETVTRVRVEQVFLIEGQVTQAQIATICRDLLADPVIQDFSFCAHPSRVSSAQAGVRVVEIAYHPGVMDPVEESTLKGICDLGISHVKSVRTAKRYHLYGSPSEADVQTIVSRVLANKLIQHVVREAPPVQAFSALKQAHKAPVVQVDILRASSAQLMQMSTQGQLFLNLHEMRAIQKYFQKQGRNPTDCELETVAQTWSEHCQHKTFRGDIAYQTVVKGKKRTTRIRSLLKTTIMKATQKVNAPWCVSVFHDNSGIVKFDHDTHVCFKVETHNHPSALEPFGGANTGIGGVIRDALGTGLGAKPIANTDVFCFAPPTVPFSQLPEGALHPLRVMKGVVSGVRDYGNKMGIPTVNGSVVFHKDFIGNPLVYCGTVGIIPKNKVNKKAKEGDWIVALGGKTGRDGIHGATFSSGELTEDSETVSSGAVQIGHPIQEKKVLDVLLRARDLGLYDAITDCGAGGFSSAVGEMAQHLGCRVYLDRAPTKYEGLTYDEIWISESQERMVLAVPKAKLNSFLKLVEEENVEAVVLGEFTSTKRLELFYHGVQVCNLEMSFLHEGVPRIAKKAIWTPSQNKEPVMACPKDLGLTLHKILGDYNICSKESIVRRYDHEVQGGSVVKPFVGVFSDGPSDASVLRPKYESQKGIAISHGINPRYGLIDPYWMAMACIDEAIRQIICVGGTLRQIAILDNFCWGNPDKPDRLGSLVRAAYGCYDAAVGFRTPFISGKDSLYNEYAYRGKTIAIPGTVLISALGIVENVNKAVTMDLKKENHLLYLVGETRPEMGGSIYYALSDKIGRSVPQTKISQAMRGYQAVEKAIAQGLIQSCHDCSDGGLAVALAEMAFAGNLGATVSLADVPGCALCKREDYLLFSESPSRLIVEVAPEHQKQFERLLRGVSCGLIGRTQADPTLMMFGLNQQVCLRSSIATLKQAWQKTLKEI